MLLRVNLFIYVAWLIYNSSLNIVLRSALEYHLKCVMHRESSKTS